MENKDKQQEAIKADFEKRVQDLIKDIQALSDKYQIEIVAFLETTPASIVPKMGFRDNKQKYEHRVEEKIIT